MLMSENFLSNFNFFEGLLWLGLSAIFFKIKVFKKQPDKKADYIVAVLLIFFGISDFIEMKTGAWWKPLWLLGWKGINLFALIFTFFKFYKK